MFIEGLLLQIQPYFSGGTKWTGFCGLSDVPDCLLLKATTTILSHTGLIQDLSVDIWNSLQCQKKKKNTKNEPNKAVYLKLTTPHVLRY